ncbi:MAG: glycosyltransferase 87 family protein [Candidatus Nanopelagicales bacterium]
MLTSLRGSPVAVAATWVVTRVLLIGALTGAVPYPDGPSILNDVKLYAEWSDLLVTGRFPIGDDMWQYPPGAGIVFAIAALLGSNPVAAFALIALACDLATLGVLIVAGRRRGAGLDAAWAWVIGAVLVGPVWLARFDVVPTLAAVVALVLIGRPTLSGAAAAAGTLLKVWPGIMLIALPRRSLPRGILGFALMAAGILAGVMIWSTGGVSFLGEQGARGLQVESVGALPFMVWNVVADVPTEFRFGAMEVDVPATIPIGLVITLSGFAILGILGVLRLMGRLELSAPADVALAALLVSIVTSRVLSPQYDVWIVGVAAVTLLDPRSLMRTARWLLAGSILVTQAVYPFAYGSFLSGDWWAVLLQVVRIALLLAATGVGLWVVLRSALRRPTSASAPQGAAAELGG